MSLHRRGVFARANVSKRPPVFFSALGVASASEVPTKAKCRRKLQAFLLFRHVGPPSCTSAAHVSLAQRRALRWKRPELTRSRLIHHKAAHVPQKHLCEPHVSAVHVLRVLRLAPTVWQSLHILWIKEQCVLHFRRRRSAARPSTAEAPAVSSHSAASLVLAPSLRSDQTDGVRVCMACARQDSRASFCVGPPFQVCHQRANLRAVGERGGGGGAATRGSRKLTVQRRGQQRVNVVSARLETQKRLPGALHLAVIGRSGGLRVLDCRRGALHTGPVLPRQLRHVLH